MKILVADDVPENRYMLEQLLRGHGHEVQSAEDGVAALEQLSAGGFDLVITDIMMPRMDGFELCYNVKLDPKLKQLRLIFYTANYTSDEDRAFALSLGADAFVLKPMEPEIFLQQMEEVLHRAAAVETKTIQAGLTPSQLEFLRGYNARLVQKLWRNAEELRRANVAKDRFIGMLSHELRTPLNPVLLVASEAAADQSLPDAIRDRFRLIADHIEVEAKLIDELLDVSQMSRRSLALDLRPIDLHDCVHETVSAFAPEMKAQGLELTMGLDAIPSTVVGDARRVRQILANVVKNALTFTPRGGRISIETLNTEATVELTIRDTGFGMSHAEVERAFEPFYQGERKRQTPETLSGLGLGLPIARTIMELHGGSVRLESGGPNQGTTVVFTFPRGAAREEAPPDLSALNANDQGARNKGNTAHPRRILLVEDHEATRAALAEMLRRRGYQISSAANVEEARREAAAKQMDVLLSDLGLPDGDGCSLMRELREKNPRIFGIAISGFGMEADITRCRAAGFSEHLTKPVGIARIMEALAQFPGGGTQR